MPPRLKHWICAALLVPGLLRALFASAQDQEHRWLRGGPQTASYEVRNTLESGDLHARHGRPRRTRQQ